MAEDINLDTVDPFDVPSIDFIERGGVRFPAVTSRQCSVCMSEWRACIEVWYVKGVKAPEILRRLQNPEGISDNSIRHHFNAEHVPSQNTIFLQHQIRKAHEQGLSLDEWESGQQQEVVAVEMVVGKFREALANEAYTPSMRDGLAASKLLFEMKAGMAEGTYDPNDMFLALATFINHTRTVMMKYNPTQVEGMMADLGSLLEEDQILRTLVQKTKEIEASSILDERDDPDERVVDAVVVMPGTWDDEPE